MQDHTELHEDLPEEPGPGRCYTEDEDDAFAVQACVEAGDPVVMLMDAYGR